MHMLVRHPAKTLLHLRMSLHSRMERRLCVDRHLSIVTLFTCRHLLVLIRVHVAYGHEALRQTVLHGSVVCILVLQVIVARSIGRHSDSSLKSVISLHINRVQINKKELILIKIETTTVL